ncbi:2-oxoacid:acceptor oxidoreductase family protein [Anoxybacterium hadale]|uniref:2-oxoacid:acceptor oxidoreductase family protein n=1 Tax=Anoxybacterium hadale TaxID=3408580 RepID=UPI003AFF9B23
MNLIFAGFGGQGVLTAGLIMGKTGVDVGKNVTWIPSYGSEMRGGTANCNVKISDGKIASPFVTKIDILVVMNMPSLAKFEENVVSGGVVIANKTLIGQYNFRKDIQVYEVDATRIADEAENPKGANIVMLGALAASGAMFDAEITWKGIENFFLEKGKSNPKNELVFYTGFTETSKKEI